MKYADKIRMHLISCPGIFTLVSLRSTLGGRQSTANQALQELIESGEVVKCANVPGRRTCQYRVTAKLRAPEERAPKPVVTIFTRPPAVVGARVVRFVETAQDADPDHGVYYHRPQPAQAAMQAKSGPGMIW